jgi:hypothetical protein
MLAQQPIRDPLFMQIPRCSLNCEFQPLHHSKMSSLSTSDSNFWLVVAPAQNFENIPTIKVVNHEVPLPVYFHIHALIEGGGPENDIVKDVMRHTGTKTLRVVTEIVSNVAENHRLVNAVPKPTPNRFSALLTSPRARISDYRASRIEARQELQAVEKHLDTLKETESKVVNEALILDQRRDELRDIKMAPEDRRKTQAAIEQQIKQTVQKHQDIEAEIQHNKRLQMIHRASLA